MKRVGTGALLLCLIVACNAPGSVDEDANKAPSVTNPGNQESRVGESVTLSIEATDPEGDALTFSAAGLPSGLSIDAAGTVTGSPTQEESASVTVTVDDAKGNSPSVAFDWLIKEALPLAPPDFKVEADYSAAEPKLIVDVSDLETEDLEKLEYRLERFSSDCFDAEDVKTDEVIVSGAAAEFDISTTNYGAFKLSVTATYSADAFRNPIKTAFPALVLPENSDEPDVGDTTGLVYVELIDTYNGNAEQINFGGDDANTIDFTVDLQAGEDDVVEAAQFDLAGLDTDDRRWCSSDGTEFVVKPGTSTALEEVVFTGPGGTLETVFVPAGPVESTLLDGDPVLFTLYEVVFTETFTVAPDFEESESLSQRFEFLVQDCAFFDEPEEACSEFSDVSR